MSKKELENIKKGMKEYAKKLETSKEESIKFLAGAGIITTKGNLRKPYKNLCIPQN
jgi:hypothetical protein